MNGYGFQFYVNRMTINRENIAKINTFGVDYVWGKCGHFVSELNKHTYLIESGILVFELLFDFNS